MKRFIEDENRAQSVLFPERLDDYIGEDNPVRVIDNRIQSSRRLERESQRNVELVWLTGRLTPDFKRLPTSAKTMAQPFVMLGSRH